ncbi:Membrane-embedded CAAX protease MroQ [Camellia lanceoleosa]|uniref:Membrane-embedded CAAX protease MroQ n=1 Tax=Camellia lanceoleosa TaxID=1840588 RepID=A0ACC0H6K1_9ERIC|nr:Membrane-embedded CAAX protease MroQ [Camellia lanceoleosa]
MIAVRWPPPPPPPSKFRANWPRNGAAFLISSLSKPKFGPKFSIKCSCIKEEHTPKASDSEDFSLLESDIPWDSGSIWSTLALYLFSLHVPLSFGGLSVVAHFVHQPVLDPQTEALSLLAIQILELNAVLWLLRCVAKPQHKIFSFFQPKNQSKERNWLLASILGFGSLVLLVFFTSLVADQLVGPKDVNNPILKEILSSGSFSKTACILVYCIVTPLLEEIVYRGFLLTSLASEMKWYQAVAISSAVFSASHFSGENFLQLFIVGSVLGCSYCWTGNLSSSFVIHSLYNALILMITFLS